MNTRDGLAFNLLAAVVPFYRRAVNIAEMVMQEKSDADGAGVVEENADEENAENRLYNGFQGSLTESGDKTFEDTVPEASRGRIESHNLGHLVSLLLALLI